MTARTHNIHVKYYSELIYRICSFKLPQLVHTLSWSGTAPSSEFFKSRRIGRSLAIKRNQ